jgi:hypothetical protein
MEDDIAWGVMKFSTICHVKILFENKICLFNQSSYVTN